MNQKERIEKDITLFEEHVASMDQPISAIVDMARRYYDDASYYLEREDYFTAFGCINYAHGLLDAIRTEAFKDESAL
jgi:hypothetical protein